jgi:hypothetical protein
MTMKNRCILFPALALLLGWVSAGGTNPDDKFALDDTGFLVRVLENNVFGVGERIVYEVKYGFVVGAEAGFEIMMQPDTVRQAPVYHIHSWAQTTPTFSVFFKVNDNIDSYMDTRGIFTWRFEKRLHEGSYNDTKIVDYDQRVGKAYLEDDGVAGDTSDIMLFVQDAMTALFYFRLQPLEVGKPVFIQVHDIKKSYPLRIDVLKKETVKTPAGKFSCFKVEPVLESAGIFKQKGRIWIWFTDDERRIPVKMNTKILIGSISAEMTEYVQGMPLRSE